MNPLDFLLPAWNPVIVYPLINALVGLDVVFGDFGLAIVLLTMALRLVLYPLFLQQIGSQKAMQELQPALAELRKKYKDDRQRFAEEQMKIYRERGVSPLGGCLPILIQMPILFGLYSALSQLGCGLGPPPPPACPGLTREELETVLYPFVSNPVATAGGAFAGTSGLLPWLAEGLAKADPWHVLPILAGVTTLVSSLMTLPARTPKDADPMTRSMQGMVYYFPFVTVFFAWSLPAGLALYWVASTVFSIAQQHFVMGWGRLGLWLPWLERLPGAGHVASRPNRGASRPEEPPIQIPKQEEQQPREGQKRRRRRRR